MAEALLPLKRRLPEAAADAVKCTSAYPLEAFPTTEALQNADLLLKLIEAPNVTC